MYKSLSKYLFILLILAAASATGFAQEVFLEYYGEMGCSHCDLFQEKILPKAEKEAGIEAEASYYDILSESGFERCKKRLQEKGYRFTVFPVLIIGNNAYQGNTAVENGLIEELAYYSRHGEYLPHIETDSPVKTINGINFPLFPIFLAGLVDGVNPCAFATIIFFISYLALIHRTGTELLLVGGMFTLAIFLTYFLIGAGALRVVTTLSFLPLARQIFIYVTAAIGIVLGTISLLDYLKYKKTGKTSDTSLQLPPRIKQMIHATIRKNVKTRHFIIMAAVTGFMVSILELACTGQIYLPTLIFISHVPELKANALIYLFIYNLMFVVPLIVVFLLTYWGTSSQKWAELNKKHFGAVKLIMTALFFGLAILLIMTGLLF